MKMKYKTIKIKFIKYTNGKQSMVRG